MLQRVAEIGENNEIIVEVTQVAVVVHHEAGEALPPAVDHREAAQGHQHEAPHRSHHIYIRD